MKHRAIFVSAILLASSAFAQTTDPVSAQNPSGSTIPIEVFNQPKLKTIRPTDEFYPPEERRAGREGWANVSFMVDPKGKPFEIWIAKSSGNKLLDQAAMKYAETWTFNPASLNGEPTDAALEFKVTFMVPGDRGARRDFVDAYRELVKAVGAKDRAAADSAMGKLHVSNLYEDAYFGLAEYVYANVWGTVGEQVAGLDRAVANESSPRFLPSAVFESALRQQLALQLQVKDFGSAASTLEKLKKLKVDNATLTELQSIASQLEAVRTGDRSYTVKGEIENNGWHFRLFKKQFRIKVAEGRIAQLKLACDKKYVFFEFDPTLDYKIGDTYGKCFMSVVGDPATKFDLVQF